MVRAVRSLWADVWWGLLLITIAPQARSILRSYKVITLWDDFRLLPVPLRLTEPRRTKMARKYFVPRMVVFGMTERSFYYGTKYASRSLEEENEKELEQRKKEEKEEIRKLLRTPGYKLGGQWRTAKTAGL